MSARKTALYRLLRPRLRWILLLTLLCTPALIVLFLQERDQSVAAYPIYVLSAYTVLAWALRVPQAVQRVRAAVYAHHLGRRYMEDLQFRGSVSLHLSTGVNLCYALFKLAVGIYYRSLWFGAVAVYYLVLLGIKALLLRGTYHKPPDLKREYETVRSCGGLLFLLTLALSFMTVQMVVAGKGYRYPGTLIFVVALYAFYSMTMAVVNLVRFRRLNSPVLISSKLLVLATALVSMLSLQTAMFASFGGEAQLQKSMNALTGGAVCLTLLLMAIFMVARANREIKEMEI